MPLCVTQTVMKITLFEFSWHLKFVASPIILRAILGIPLGEASTDFRIFGLEVATSLVSVCEVTPNRLNGFFAVQMFHCNMGARCNFLDADKYSVRVSDPRRHELAATNFLLS